MPAPSPHQPCYNLQAKDSYQKAVDLEPDDAHLLDALHKADIAERKEAEQKRHKFKRKDVSLQQADKTNTKKQKAAPKCSLLSFDDEEV